MNEGVVTKRAANIATKTAKKCPACKRYFDKPKCPYCEAIASRTKGGQS